MVGFTAVLPSVAGRIMERELTSLSKALEKPEHPCVYVMGGGKADDALEISKYVITNKIADYVLTGGVVAQIFLAAKGYDLGKSNMDLIAKKGLTGFIAGIKELLGQYPEKLIVPLDLALNVAEKRQEISVKDLPTEYPIFDIGTKTAEVYAKYIFSAKSVVVSGPMGVYEKKEFAVGTKKVFTAIANSGAFSLAGGGHTISAISEFGLSGKISYISTAGGALAEFLMGKKLPGVVALETAVQTKKI
jgi:phosphoglycerate kinase